jgi:acetyl-CoA C-acetyltransferase
MLRAALSSAPSSVPRLSRGLHEAVIVSVARTPVGSFGGALAALSAPQLGAAAVRGALARLPREARVGEVLLGNVVSAGAGQAPARQAARGAAAAALAADPAAAQQLGDDAVCTTVNKVCASGMKAVALAAQSVALGQHDTVVAGGMESMSNVPFLLPAQSRFGGLRFGHSKVVDALVHDGLWDVSASASACARTRACSANCARSHSRTQALANAVRKDSSRHLILRLCAAYPTRRPRPLLCAPASALQRREHG